MGLDTVNLKGEGFEVKVGKGDKVTKGDVLAVMDINLIEEKGYNTITPIVILNRDRFAINHSTLENEVNRNDVLMDVVRK